METSLMGTVAITYKLTLTRTGEPEIIEGNTEKGFMEI